MIILIYSAYSAVSIDLASNVRHDRARPGMPCIRFDQVDEKYSHIIIVLLEMHAVYEVARENLAHLPHESSDLGSVPASSRIL